MSLRAELLAPIAGDNPSGKSLRYERVYDQIKEARTEEDDTLPAGAWERTAKRADYRLVIKLATEALTSKSKDLQLAAWLGEAHIRQEGAAQLAPVLELLLQLQENFWDTLYPELDEGDAGLRAVPLQWAANRYAGLVYEFPLTKSKLNFLTYKAARALGSEADVAGNEVRRKARAEAISRGQITSEEVDQAIAETPKSLQASLEEALREGLDRLEALAIFCEERYGDDGPSFRKLRESMEEVHNLVAAQLNEKRRLDPDPVPVAEALNAAQPEPAPVAVPVVAVAATPATIPAPVVPVAPSPVASAVPSVAVSAGSWEEAEAKICALAQTMAQQRRGSAVPYLIQTSIRWGEIRREMPRPPIPMMEPLSAQDRNFLKSAASEGRWSDLLDRSMALVGEAPGRACLDLQRYVWQATSQLGFGYFADVVRRSVRELLVDFPDLPNWTLADNTPTADAETQQWLAAQVRVAVEEDESNPELLSPQTAEMSVPPEPVPVPVVVPPPAAVAVQVAVPVAVPVHVPSPADLGGAGDSLLAQATAMANAGQLREATRLLARDAATQPTGRLRYRRRLDLAQLCVRGDSAAIAAPVLRELIEEIDERKLESWEEFDMVTRPMTLMLQCMTRPEDVTQREQLLARLSRIDPTAALEILP